MAEVEQQQDINVSDDKIVVSTPDSPNIEASSPSTPNMSSRLVEKMKREQKRASTTLTDVAKKRSPNDVKQLLHPIEDKHVHVLDLSDKKLGNDDLKEVCEQLASNTNIIELNLQKNNFDDTGCQYLADLIKKNNTLQSILLDDNFIRDDGAAALLEAMKNNSTLFELTLTDGLISEDILDPLEEILQHNFEQFEAKEEKIHPEPAEKPIINEDEFDDTE